MLEEARRASADAELDHARDKRTNPEEELSKLNDELEAVQSEHRQVQRSSHAHRVLIIACSSTPQRVLVASSPPHHHRLLLSSPPLTLPTPRSHLSKTNASSHLCSSPQLEVEKESAEKQLKELMARFKLRKALLHWRHRKLTLSFRSLVTMVTTRPGSNPPCGGSNPSCGGCNPEGLATCHWQARGIGPALSSAPPGLLLACRMPSSPPFAPLACHMPRSALTGV